ncbi:right-handed parallel beta-helix repeat-containing protein [Winogradskyella sp. PG-2]|uniref:right-handed parallel beta-helix repeat-containing protein n=1 Tax=Winogradskyella sp. PG-2 TaxID=754409 RepID=UPI00045875CE|nr:right-handed parallel beta-helix repeat-containing protein [Winogradskyella sp. PG-2]BAO77688.1 hypothetical protein WPG_3458 [Winogradskyella sp. PG-2]
MKRLLSFFICFGILLFWSSCRNDFEFSPSTGNLEFVKDTVYLDTVFTNIGSSTYNLKVYNRSDDDIVIPTIQLENGISSFYRMNVDGGTGLEGAQEGKFFEDVELLANDSLFIFIETTIDIETLSNSDTQFLYTDRILFDIGSNQQDVDLVTLVKDAIFIYPNRNETTGIVETLTFDVDGDGNSDETTLQGRFLEDTELTFTNEKPYVIYGYAGVDSGKTLTMDAGARVHFHANSGIIVTDNGTLNINGALSTDQEILENEVILEGDRLEPLYTDIPGQWGTIWLFNGSANNTIEYATIKNATIGILSEGNQAATNDKLTITNSQIYNTSSFGILGRATSITAENTVINNCGQSSFAGTVGGKYNFTHCTIANYWNNSFRQFPAVLLNDYVEDAEGITTLNDLTEASFNNCIIYGNDNPEIFLDDRGPVFSYKFTNCLIRFDDENLEGTGNYVFDNTMFYDGNSFNVDPDFEDGFENLMRIGEDSGANRLAFSLIPSGSDILGVNRDSAEPDCGAYESITFED